MSPYSYAVGAPVLLNAYWHIHVAELILDGAEPREANEACWRSYYLGGLFDYAYNNDGRPLEQSLTRAEYPAGRPAVSDPLATTPGKGPHKHWTTRCLVAALIDDERLLATSWNDLTRRHGHCARAQISTEHTRTLQWQCHMMWLLATGAGDLLRCARIAYDRAAGKSARKRRPADPSWLATELDRSLSAAWDALRTADDGARTPFWETPTGPVRPRADNADAEESIRYASFLMSLRAAGMDPRVSVFEAVAACGARINTSEGR